MNLFRVPAALSTGRRTPLKRSRIKAHNQFSSRVQSVAFPTCIQQRVLGFVLEGFDLGIREVKDCFVLVKQSLTQI